MGSGITFMEVHFHSGIKHSKYVQALTILDRASDTEYVIS